MAGGTRCESLVSSLDYVPLFYCRLRPGTAGNACKVKSLAPLLSRSRRFPTATSVFSENMGSQMVRDARYKYAHYATGESELYDLEYRPR